MVRQHSPTKGGILCVHVHIQRTLYSMDLRISVVITRHEAFGLMVTSPVIKPTSLNSSANSLLFFYSSLNWTKLDENFTM